MLFVQVIRFIDLTMHSKPHDCHKCNFAGIMNSIFLQNFFFILNSIPKSEFILRNIGKEKISGRNKQKFLNSFKVPPLSHLVIWMSLPRIIKMILEMNHNHIRMLISIQKIFCVVMSQLQKSLTEVYQWLVLTKTKINTNCMSIRYRYRSVLCETNVLQLHLISDKGLYEN